MSRCGLLNVAVATKRKLRRAAPVNLTQLGLIIFGNFIIQVFIKKWAEKSLCW
jgi:hypothetical protein